MVYLGNAVGTISSRARNNADRLGINTGMAVRTSWLATDLQPTIIEKNSPSSSPNLHHRGPTRKVRRNVM